MKTEPYKEEAAAAYSWWKHLQPRETDGRVVRGDRAAIARLKRAASIMEAAAEPATADLYKKLGFTDPSNLPRAALLAAVLAHVRKDDPRQPFAEAIGTSRSGVDTTALISPLRFKRLIAAREPDDLLIAFRRAVAILGKEANVRDLARLLLGFTDERWSDISRTRFAFAYHGAALAAPEPDTERIAI